MASEEQSNSTIASRLSAGLEVAEQARLEQVSEVAVVEDAVVVLTKAYSHRGHNLVTPDNATFFGYPGVKVSVQVGDEVEAVVLSPVHGHHERVGGEAIAEGTLCRICCPVTGEELPAYAPCSCGRAQLRSIYLTPDLDQAHVVAICEVWGCPCSRIVDEWEILSEFVARETEAEVAA